MAGNDFCPVQATYRWDFSTIWAHLRMSRQRKSTHDQKHADVDRGGHLRMRVASRSSADYNECTIMNTSSKLPRRSFLSSSAVITAAAAVGLPLCASFTSAAASQASTAAPPQDDAHGRLKLGIASYSLRKFTLDEAIAMTKKARVRYITLKDMHLPMKSTREQRQEARKEITDAGLVLMGGGVIYLKNDEKEVRSAFEYVKDAGMPTMVCSPDVAALNLVEKFADEYDVKVAIHNHGPGDNKYPSPLDVLRLVKDRSMRMGVCMDVGHTVRINQDPLPIIKECGPRMHDFHIKDVNAATEKGAPVEVGRGIIDIPGVLKALLDIGFAGHLALEYEIKPEDPLPGMVESFAYIRGALAAM